MQGPEGIPPPQQHPAERDDLTRLRRSRSYRALVEVGLASYGVVHLIIAVLALEVALGADPLVSSRGALGEIARRPLGRFLVWGMGIGLLATSFWQLTEATVPHPHAPVRWTRRVSSFGRAVAYLALGLLALGTALNADAPVQPDDSATARLLDTAPGPYVIAVVGGVVVGVGVAEVYRGAAMTFRADLARRVGRPTVVLGAVGYVAKGLVLILVGALIAVAGITRDANDVGGMDVALARLGQHQFGPALLVVMASGLGCFGLYCLVWSRRLRF